MHCSYQCVKVRVSFFDMQEEWRDVVGYEGMYMVSNLGRVRSLAFVYPWHGSIKFNNPKVLSPYNDSQGYRQVELRGKALLVHRIVAMAFIPNPNNYRCVNHKDENPQNNRVDNLEWCTHEYNVKYSREKIARRNIEVHGRPIYRIDLATGKRFDYPYINAVVVDGFGPKQVSAACAGSYNPQSKKSNHNKYKNNLWYYA